MIVVPAAAIRCDSFIPDGGATSESRVHPVFLMGAARRRGEGPLAFTFAK
ncbi:MAG: hypothetical protein O3A00_12910 [Planctomycetota bacterium]|nr:hypothetical protein [Planctomycetota bacterium]